MMMVDVLPTVLRRTLVPLFIVVVATVFTTSASVAEVKPVTAQEAAPTSSVFTVDGQLSSPRSLTVEGLRRDYPGYDAVSQFKNGCVTREHRYRGALLMDVLAAAGPQFDPTIENVKLRYAVLVTATDHYQAVLSWGEIDPNYANTQVLLAYEQDGVLLTRPHLIVPGDARPGRYVRNITNISLQQVVH